eukprot:5750086-Alexandrium_andersonii.AAC.1
MDGGGVLEGELGGNWSVRGWVGVGEGAWYPNFAPVGAVVFFTGGEYEGVEVDCWQRAARVS